MDTVDLRAEDIVIGDLVHFWGARRERVVTLMMGTSVDVSGDEHGTVTLFSKRGNMRRFNLDDIVAVRRNV